VAAESASVVLRAQGKSVGFARSVSVCEPRLVGRVGEMGGEAVS
jgi:hypothetical protein